MRYAIVQTDEDGYWFLESISPNGDHVWGHVERHALLWADRRFAAIVADNLRAEVIEVRL